MQITKQKENLNLCVFAILDERAKHPSKTLAQLYDPEMMPKLGRYKQNVIPSVSIQGSCEEFRADSCHN